MGRNNIRLAYLNFGPQKVSFCYIFSQTSSRRTKCEIKKFRKLPKCPPHMGCMAKHPKFQKKKKEKREKKSERQAKPS